MARTPSNMLPLGTLAPDFTLADTVGRKLVSLKEVMGKKGTVVAFICNHCPYVKHINHNLVHLASRYQPRGIGFVAISSNDASMYPEDGPDYMRQNALDEEYCFPYLYDGTQEIARAYDAACTPDFYLFDTDLKLVYRGQLDDSRPGNEVPVTGRDLEQAIHNLIDGLPIVPLQKPSLGCNIKWKKNT